MSSPARFYHPFVISDVDHILKLHSLKPSTLAEQHDNLRRINQVVGAKLGLQYSVLDVSPGRYSTPLELVRQELCIIDPEPQDLSKRKIKEQLPDIYQPQQTVLDEALRESGYQVKPLYDYPSKLLDALLPPREVSGHGRPFILHPPSPAHTELQAFLQICSLTLPSLPKLLGFLNLWIRSYNMEDIFPSSCIALMTLTYLQNRHQLPSPFEGQQYDFVPLSNELIDGWFDFWSGDTVRAFKLKVDIASVRVPGGILLRDDANPPTPPTPDKPLYEQTPGVQSNVAKQEPISGLPQPKFWRGAALIVQDPFLLSHNHAHQVGPKDLKLFMTICRNTRANLRKTGPPHVSMFGPSFIALPPTPPGSARVASKQLTQQLKTMFKSTRPPKQVLKNRQIIVDRISTAIRARYGNTYIVQCFGSTRYGVDSPTSDLDMVIVDLNRFNGFPPEIDARNLPAIYNMRSLGQIILQAGFDQVVPIHSATVPIVKFHDPKTDIYIDINCNERLGMLNTQLLESYCRIYPDLPVFIYFIKKWAKSMGLNDPSGSKGPATFSSYCLALMIVGYLQSRGVLPNLQGQARITPIDRTTQGFWMRTLKGSRLWCDTRFEPDPPPHWRAANMSLGDAVCGWFRYWGYEHPYDTALLNIRDGGIAPRRHSFHGTQAAATKNSRAKANGARKGTLESTRVDPPVGAVAPMTDNTAMGADNARDADKDSQPFAQVDFAPLEILESEKENPMTVPELGKAVDGSISEELDLAAPPGEEPTLWKQGKLIVVDPFIAAKNCSGGCQPRVIERFQLECQRVASYLESGASIESLFIPGSDWLFGGTAGKPIRGTPRPIDSHQRKGQAPTRTETRKNKGKERGTEPGQPRATPRSPSSRSPSPKQRQDNRHQQSREQYRARKKPTNDNTKQRSRSPSPGKQQRRRSPRPANPSAPSNTKPNTQQADSPAVIPSKPRPTKSSRIFADALRKASVIPSP